MSNHMSDQSIIFKHRMLKIGHYAAIGCYVIFALFPLYWLLKVSVTPTKLLYSEGVRMWPSTTTWEHFIFVSTKSNFPTFFANSLIVSIGTAIAATVVAAFAGYAFSRFRFKGKLIIIGILFLTQAFPIVMVIVPIYKLLSPLGLTNSLLGLIIVFTAFNVPFATFLMQAFFDDIPVQLEEAATIDGCSRFQALRLVIAPLTLPGIGATLGFVFTAAWSELLMSLMLLNSANKMTFAVGLLSFVSKFSVNWGQMMAASVMALIPACLFFIYIQRYLVKGLTSGAVKG
jgi:multiple sugar transport system permease protein